MNNEPLVVSSSQMSLTSSQGQQIFEALNKGFEVLLQKRDKTLVVSMDTTGQELKKFLS